MGHTDLTRRGFLFGAKAEKAMDDEQGATAIEYGLIGALIGVAIVSSVSLLGRRTRANVVCINRAIRGREQTRFCKRRGA